MRHSHPRSFHDQAAVLRGQFLQDGGLPVTDVLTVQFLSQPLAGVVTKSVGYASSRGLVK